MYIYKEKNLLFNLIIIWMKCKYDTCSYVCVFLGIRGSNTEEFRAGWGRGGDKQGRGYGERLVIIQLEIDPVELKLRADRLSTVALISFQSTEV